MYCNNLQATISERACRSAQKVARQTRDMIYKKYQYMCSKEKLLHEDITALQRGMSDFRLTRFVACARCNKCSTVAHADLEPLREIARAGLMWFHDKAYRPGKGSPNKTELRNRYKNL